MRIITGAILILIGLLFLLENTHLFGFEFGEFVSTYWPVALIFIGIVLIYRKAKSDDEEAWKEFVGKEYSKSVGDLKLRPKSINADGLSAKHGLGDLIVDLTDCSLAAGENKLECTLGAGELKVKLVRYICWARTLTVSVAPLNMRTKATQALLLGCS
jgi:predicted membrane protein